MVKATEIRRNGVRCFVTLTASIAAATELLKLTAIRLNNFCVQCTALSGEVSAR